MFKAVNIHNRETLSEVLQWAVALSGGLVFIHSAGSLEFPKEPTILCLLVLFLGINEYFPMPVWKGQTTITIPIVYVLCLLYGLPYALAAYGSVVLFINALRQRPLRILFFRPGKILISFGIAFTLASVTLAEVNNQSSVLYGIFHYCVTLVIFYLVNNIIDDAVNLLNPRPYTISKWIQKLYTEISSAGISLAYGILFYIIGNTNRGEIDVFSFFFFFSPLVGIAIISSTISRLRIEKQRLKTLSSITRKLNHLQPTNEWVDTLKSKFGDFFSSDASVLWMKENDSWKLRFYEGLVHERVTLSEEAFYRLEKIDKPVKFEDLHDYGPAHPLFHYSLTSFVYSPLVIEDETVGMFIVARSRTNSFRKDDIRSISTLSNQLAVIFKTRVLFTERERRIILEERNRIARDIHDGVAQTLAGAIMNLESAEKKFLKNPSEALKLLKDSEIKLRYSLREVRDSIYALRPYPTDKVGLTAAIYSKIEELMKEYNVEIDFIIRGNEIELSSMVEKIMFDTFKESVQNSIKHSGGSRIDVLISYQAEQILLKIKDHGKGFSLYQAMIKARNQPHFGILQMNDAAEKINASLQIDSKAGIGTEIVLTVPKMGLEGRELYDQAHASG